MRVDAAGPRATFTGPLPNVVTATTSSSVTVSWTETVTSGTHIISRRLSTERSAQAGAGTCAGAQWVAIGATTAASPVSSTGLGRLYCYRYSLVLTDSAGHTSTTVSAVVQEPSV
jgi:hypothetical protein